MELVLDINILAVVLVSAVVGIVFIKNYSKSPDYLRSRIRDKDEIIKDLTTKYNSYRAKYNRVINGIRLPAGTKPAQNIEEAEQLVPSVVDSFLPYIPKKFQGIAKSPQIQKVLQEIYTKAMKDHPQEATEFINAFVPQVAQSVADMKSSNSDPTYI